VNEHQRAVIAYRQEENRVLREVQGRKRLRFNGDRRRSLDRVLEQDGGENPREAAWVTGRSTYSPANTSISSEQPPSRR